MPNGAQPQIVIEGLLSSFEKETGYKTKLKILDWGEAWARVHDALEKGEGPDVLQLGTTWIPYFADKNQLTVLNLKNKKIDLNRFIPINLRAGQIYGNLKQYSLPCSLMLEVCWETKNIWIS